MQVELEFFNESEPLTVPFNVSADESPPGRRRLREGTVRGERTRRVRHDELLGARGGSSSDRQLQSSTQVRLLT